jgi:hypothetical protein
VPRLGACLERVARVWKEAELVEAVAFAVVASIWAFRSMLTYQPDPRPDG